MGGLFATYLYAPCSSFSIESGGRAAEKPCSPRITTGPRTDRGGLSSWSDCSSHGCGRSPAAPTQQIDLRSHLDEWIARRVDAVNPRKRVENNLPPFRGQLVHALRDGQGTELHHLSALGPFHGGIGNYVSHIGQLYQDAKPHRPVGQSF